MINYGFCKSVDLTKFQNTFVNINGRKCQHKFDNHFIRNANSATKSHHHSMQTNHQAKFHFRHNLSAKSTGQVKEPFHVIQSGNQVDLSIFFFECGRQK